MVTRKKLMHHTSAAARSVAIGLLILIIIIAGVIYFSANSINWSAVKIPNIQMPNLGSQSSPPINSASDPISVSVMLQDYSQNQAQADSEYTGKLVYLSGSVANVETYNGNYASCVGIQDFEETGCVTMQESAFSGWAIWNWASQSAASDVSVNSQFIAKCKVGGFANGDLTLNSCTVVNSPTNSGVSYSAQANNCTSFLSTVSLTSAEYIVNPGDGNLSFYVHNTGNSAIVLNRLGVVHYNISIPQQTTRFVNLTDLRLGLPGTTLNLAVGFAPPSGFTNSQVFGGSCSIAVTVVILNNESSTK